MTTNLEIGIQCQVRGKVEEEGAVTVQARTLSDYINLLPRENIQLATTDQTLAVTAKKSKTAMKGIDAADFPLIPEVEAKNEQTVPAGTLRQALTSVAFAVAYDETRPEISGVYFNFDGTTLVLAATDSYRLAEKRVALDKPVAKAHGVIVPIRTVQELIRVLSDSDEPVVIQSNENQIVFTLGETRLTSRVIEGQYPDYRQIIPAEHQTRLTASTAELVNTVKRASLFCKPGSNDIQVHASKQDSEAVVSAANLQIGESEARQEVAVEGADNSIVFNYRFVLDGLQNISASECCLDITNSSSPGVLRPKGSDDYVYIIMPIRQ